MEVPESESESDYPPASDESPAAFGALATTGLWLSVLVLEMVLSCSFGLVFLVVTGSLSSDPELMERRIESALSTNAFLVGSTLLFSALWLLGLTIVVRTKGFTALDYFAFRNTPKRAWVAWSIAFAGLWILGWTVSHILERPTPEFMTDVFDDGRLLVLTGFCLVVVAPLVEEIVYRGFLYRGLASSRLGAGGAILVSSFLWAILHVQYEWYEVAYIFVLGLFLGLVRARTGSVLPPMAFHAVQNLVAMLLVGASGG